MSNMLGHCHCVGFFACQCIDAIEECSVPLCCMLGVAIYLFFVDMHGPSLVFPLNMRRHVHAQSDTRKTIKTILIVRTCSATVILPKAMFDAILTRRTAFTTAIPFRYGY